MSVSLFPRALSGDAPMSLTSIFFVFSVTMLVLTLAMIQGRSESRRGPSYGDGLLEGVQLVQVTRSEVRGWRLMRLGRIISSLCCVEETDKTVTPFPENRLCIMGFICSLSLVASIISP